MGGLPRRVGPVVLAGVFLAGLPFPARAQSPTQVVERFRDSLASITDTAALRRAYRSKDAAGQRGDSLAELREGLTALRLAEVDSTGDGGEALDRLGRVTRRHPGWAPGWHALGLAEVLRAAREQGDPLALGSRVGVGRLERAARRQRRALEAEPGYLPAALALAELTLRLRDTALMGPARDALRRAVAASPAPAPELLLAWGRLERAAGSSDSADAAFGRFLGAGGDTALGLLERARTRLAQGIAAESLYFAGAALDDPPAVAGYRADLAPIAEDSQLVRFDRLRGAERAGYLRRFWTDRDRYEMRADGERLREHYRRLLHARRSFALTVSRRFHGTVDAYRSGSEELDDRGVIYVRHGEPVERLRPFVFGLMPNESWRYHRADGDLLFHFSSGYDQSGGGDLYDYRLVESVLDLRGAAEAPIDQLMLSRQTMSPVYGRMLNWSGYGKARSRARERGIGQASIAIGTSTDTYELQFGRPLAALADLVAVGSGPNGRLVHVVFALGAPGTTPVRTASGVRYPVRVRVVALPGSALTPVSLDTTVNLRADRPLAEGAYLVGRAELSLPAGEWAWRAALSQGDSAGVVLSGDTVTVARPGALRLSDLALGSRETSAAWSPAPSDTVRMTPFGLFREGGEVELYYEVDGTAAGRAYRHEIAVYRVKGEPGRPERRAAVTLAFEEPAAGTLVRAHRVLRLPRLKPGRYLVEVRLAEPGGAAVTRRREFGITRFR